MNQKEIESFNNLVKLVNHQDVVIFGLESKVEALITTIIDLAIKTGHPNLASQFDRHFWESFHNRFDELNEPSEALREIHQSLSRM